MGDLRLVQKEQAGESGVKIERKMHILEKRLTPCSQTASQTVKVHLFLLLVRLEMRFPDALIYLFAKELHFSSILWLFLEEKQDGLPH